MSKFKVGDRVRFKRSGINSCGQVPGFEDVVVSLDKNGDAVVSSDPASVADVGWSESVIEVIPPSPADPTTLTRRDRFAMVALTEMIAYCRRADGTFDVGVVAGRCYQLADAMEAARNKEGGE